MSRTDEWVQESHGMELEEKFYSFDFDAEELSEYQDPAELLVALKQKEEEVILAARLGNALLLENRQLKKESEKLHDHYAAKLEALEQDRHELRFKLSGCEAERDTQVAELEQDVCDLSTEVQRLTRALCDTQRYNSRAHEEHTEESRLLREQLDAAVEVERALSTELLALKQERWESGCGRAQDEELLSALREQVTRLAQKEQTLVCHLEVICQENAELRERLATVSDHLAVQEESAQHHSQQLTEAREEVKLARGQIRQLEDRVQELQEEPSSMEQGEASLLSELERSLGEASWGLDKEQVTQEVHSVLMVLLPLLNNESTSEEDPPRVDDGLPAVLLRLHSVAHQLAQGGRPQDLNPPLVGPNADPCENSSEVQELLDQNTKLTEENATLKQRAERSQEGALLRQAIRDRDEAIAKKNAMEAELFRSKNDLMSLNNQLLEAIQRKLELSQELEAWQDDIQVILNQQLQSQQQTEELQQKTGTRRLAFLRRPSAPTIRIRHPSSSSSSLPCTSEPRPERTQLHWRDWLKRGKMG